MEGIKKVRHRLGISLSELAQRTGLFREQIAYAERAGTDPRASTLAKLARGLGVSVSDFFEEEQHGRSRQHRRRTRAGK